MSTKDIIMSASGTGGTPDPYFNNVSLLLSGDGTNGAQNNTFLDSSSNNFTITRNGNTTQGSFSPYGSNWGNYFIKSASSYLITPLTGFNGDFTIEAWIYPTTNDSTIYSGGGTAVHEYIMVRGSGSNIEVELSAVYGGANFYPVQSFNLLNRWTHIALVKSGTTVKCYFDGVASATTLSFSATAFPTANHKIGSYSSNPTVYGFDGYISNLRVFNATAVYTSNFTPSTTPLTAISGTSLLTCQSNRFIDNSSNNFALTVNGTPSVQRFSPFAPTSAYSTATIGGSVYFDGTGDYLSTSNVCSLSANFTVECWVYYTAAPNNNTFISSIDNAGRGNWNFYYNNSVNALRIVGTSGASYIQSGTLPITPVAGSWYHFAVSRYGSTVYWWVNGVSAGTTTDSTNWTGTATETRVAIDLSGSFVFTGYISNLRVVNGTALYTTAFTPPTAPLTAVANTWILFGMTNSAIYDNAMMNDLETVGNAQISTAVKKYGTGSMYFDGTGDGLTLNANGQNFVFGTGDFTIEGWVYLNTSSQSGIIYDSRPATTSGLYPTVRLDSGVIKFYTNSATQITGSTLSASTWYHFAISRSSSQTKLFINGTQVGSTYVDTNSYINGSNRPLLGADGYDNYTATNYFNGYIDDLRITKGVARYTTNFTPPTQALPTNG